MQLCLLRPPGFGLRANQSIPHELLGYLAAQGLLRNSKIGRRVPAPILGCSPKDSRRFQEHLRTSELCNRPSKMEGPQMSHDLSLAQHHALDLAHTLIVPVTLFEVDG